MTLAISGTFLPDILTGTNPGDVGNPDGIDIINGLDGDDNLSGLGGDDTIQGGAGADIMFGGSGIDTLSYADAADGVAVLLNGAAYSGEALGDSSQEFENLRGSAHADQLAGDGGANVIEGGAGNDYIQLTAGNDTLDGGDGDSDILDGRTWGVGLTLNLATGTGSTGSGTVTLANFEWVLGSAFNDNLTGNAGIASTLAGADGDDTLTGGSADDWLYGDSFGGFTGSGTDTLNGGDGNDRLEGGALGDTLDGGAGSDTAAYSSSAARVAVSLQTGVGRGGDAAGDSLSSIENLAGSDFNDTLAGNAGNNTLSGGGGNDLLIGGAGADTLNGGNGIDTVQYRDSSALVMVSLATGYGTLGDAQGDSLSQIENVTGSLFHGDNIAGDGGANRLDGLGGGDVLSGGDGNDTLLGGDGDDEVNGDEGDDRLLGGDGNDMLTGGAGIDQLYGGTGADLFAFATVDGSTDRIRDWEAGDRIRIDQHGFGIAGVWDVVNGTSAHGLAGDVFFYHTTTGRLFFHDGDTGTRSLIAVITDNPASLSQADFVLV